MQKKLILSYENLKNLRLNEIENNSRSLFMGVVVVTTGVCIDFRLIFLLPEFHGNAKKLHSVLM